MRAVYKYDTVLQIIVEDQESEAPVTIHYRLIRGHRETFDDPGSADEAEIDSAYFNGRFEDRVPQFLIDSFMKNDALLSDLVRDAIETNQCDYDDHQEAKWRERKLTPVG